MQAPSGRRPAVLGKSGPVAAKATGPADTVPAAAAGLATLVPAVAVAGACAVEPVATSTVSGRARRPPPRRLRTTVTGWSAVASSAVALCDASKATLAVVRPGCWAAGASAGAAESGERERGGVEDLLG